MLQAAFGRLDRDRDGKIGVDELMEFLGELGHRVKRVCLGGGGVHSDGGRGVALLA